MQAGLAEIQKNIAIRLAGKYRQRIPLALSEVSFEEAREATFAEKISALRTESYLRERASRGSRQHALYLLDKVADVPPEEHDRL